MWPCRGDVPVRAVVLDAPGPPEALQTRDLAVPVPVPGDVLLTWGLTTCLPLSYVVVSVLVRFPTRWCWVGRVFFDPAGRPGPGRLGFGAPAWSGIVARMRGNPRRTRAGVSRSGAADRSQGRRRSSARCRARRSWV